MALPKYLTTVTPFSKYLAMALFVLLPFIAFYLGIQYQKMVTPTFPPTQYIPPPQKEVLPPSKVLPTITPQISCMPRPACLDATPRCMLMEPAQGWCATTLTPKQNSIKLQK